MRCLDIGPGRKRIEGFETVDCVSGPLVDHVADARALPFPDETFTRVHASHVIEHLPWFDTDRVLTEWVRVLLPGGRLDVWTVDAYKLARALTIYEETGEWTGPTLGEGTWKHPWVQGDPVKFVSGRVFSYAKLGQGNADPYWHHALFTPRSLTAALERAGLIDVRPLPDTERLGHNHRWINLGVRGWKP